MGDLERRYREAYKQALEAVETLEKRKVDRKDAERLAEDGRWALKLCLDVLDRPKGEIVYL